MNHPTPASPRSSNDPNDQIELAKKEQSGRLTTSQIALLGSLLSVVSGMAGAMVLSGVVVCYLLLRDGAYRSLLRMCLALINLAMLPMGF